MHKVPPYNTGKVKIGEHYVPPTRRNFSREELLWQRTLTEPKPKPSLADKIKLWVYGVFLVFTIVALALGEYR